MDIYKPEPSPSAQIPDQAEPATGHKEAEQMLDVKIPHVHAPHGEVGGWRGFAMHIAVVAIGLFLALILEQGVETLHHEFQRAALEAQMRETFQANSVRADNDVRVLNDFRAYLIDLRSAVRARIAGGSAPGPRASDPRNITFVPPPTFGAYEAAKGNGSVSLLELNRVQLYDRIAFQQDLMVRSFHQFLDSVGDLRAFADEVGQADENFPGKLVQPDISELSAAQLVEYQALLARLIQYDRQYASQLKGLKTAYQLMLGGANDVNVLINNRPKAP